MYFAPIFDQAAQQVLAGADISDVVDMYEMQYNLDVVEAGELYVALAQLI